MNKRTAYETIIAEKAEQQPLPDMADAIWAAVSARLDALPASGGNGDAGSADAAGPASSPAPVAPAIKGAAAWQLVLWGAGVAALATMAVLFWHSRQQGPSLPQKQLPVRTAPVQQPPKENVRHDSVKQKPSVVLYVPAEEKKPAVIDSARKINDTLMGNRVQGAIQITPPRMPSLATPDTASIALPQARKPHGVKGLSDSDYKIVPTEQDSLPGKKRH